MIKLIKSNIKSFSKYLKENKFAVITATIAYLTVLVMSWYSFLPINSIDVNSTQNEINDFINKFNIIVLIANAFLIYTVLALFLSLLKYLIKNSILNNDKQSNYIFLTMIFIICLTIFGFGYIYEISSNIISNYTDIIINIETLISKHPYIKITSFNKDIINFIKNSDLDFNVMFITEKEAINTFDYYLFSAVTFFSGSHTDITPNNVIIQIIVLLENITTFIITIVYIPIIINFIQVNKKEEKQKKNNNCNVNLSIQQDNTTLVYELKKVIEK